MRLTALLALILSSSCAALADTSPRATVDAIFDAMRAGDGAAIETHLSDTATLGRVGADGTFQTIPIEAWTDSVSGAGPGILDEQIFSVEVRTFGDFAHVWAPFTIARNGEIFGCGVNQFVLARSEEAWTVVHLVDTQDTGDCLTFKDRYTSQGN